MSTSPLYDSTRQQLSTQLTDALASQLETLALVVVAIGQLVSAQIGTIARAMPLDTTLAAKEQRLRRLLDTERLTQDKHYHPVAKAALRGLKGQRVQVLIDRVLLRDTHNILVATVAFRRRWLALAWLALSHRGQSGLADQKDVLTQALSILPEGVRVSVHGDSEFRSQDLFVWLRERGADVMMGIPRYILVAETSHGPTAASESWLPNLECVAYAESSLYAVIRLHFILPSLAWVERSSHQLEYIRTGRYISASSRVSAPSGPGNEAALAEAIKGFCEQMEKEQTHA